MGSDPDAEPAPEPRPSEPRADPELRFLHPVTLGFAFAGLLRAYLLPAVLILAWGGRARALLLLVGAGLAAATAARALLAYLFFRYGIRGDEVVTRAGVIATEERHIPIARIQDIKIEATLVERIFGVATVAIETAGGASPEVVLASVGQADAEALREAIEDRRARGPRSDPRAPATGKRARPRPAPREDLLALVPASDLVLAGVTSTRASLVVLVAVGFLYQAADLVPLLGRPIEAMVALALGLAAANPLLGGAVLLVALGAVLALGLGLSGLLMAIRFYGFALVRRGSELRREHGLFTTRASSLPERRLQAVVVDEGGVRTWIGMGAVHAVSAGSVRGGLGEQSEGRDVVLPIGRREEAWAMAAGLLRGLDRDPRGLAWTPPARRGAYRFGGLAAASALGLAAVLGAATTPAFGALIAGVGLIAAAVLALLRQRRLGFALAGDLVLVRKGYVGVKTAVVPLRKLQSAAVERGPLERLLGLARVNLDTAGQPVLDRPVIPDLAAKDAHALVAALAKRAAALPFRW